MQRTIDRLFRKAKKKGRRKIKIIKITYDQIEIHLSVIARLFSVPPVRHVASRLGFDDGVKVIVFVPEPFAAAQDVARVHSFHDVTAPVRECVDGFVAAALCEGRVAGDYGGECEEREGEELEELHFCGVGGNGCWKWVLGKEGRGERAVAVERRV